MKTIKGDLIKLAKAGEFDVIAHGCNCMNVQGAGIAKQMAEAFNTDNDNTFFYEEVKHKGNINKLGCIDIALRIGDMVKWTDGWNNNIEYLNFLKKEQQEKKGLFIVNAYTQFEPGVNNIYPGHPPLDYNALRMCFIKMNYLFAGLKVGLPLIGCGLAGGDPKIVKYCMKEFLNDVDLTLVEYDN